MKYLVQHTKELIITIGVFLTLAVVLAWVISAAVRGELSYEHVIALLGDVFVFLGWYYNMPTSPQNLEHTTLMRLEKIKDELEYGYFEDGEEYEDEPDEEEVEEGETDE